MTNFTAKIAFLHAAHNFATEPSAANKRALDTAMQMHRVAFARANPAWVSYAPVLLEGSIPPRSGVENFPAPVDYTARIAEVQALENERLGR